MAVPHRMKRKPLPDREREIAQRLRQMRELLRFSQAEFAEQVGSNRQRIADCEAGRVALRCELALRLCRQFVIGEKWLATGHGRPRQYLSLTLDMAGPRIGAQSTFSQVYDKVLSLAYEARLQKWPTNVVVMVRQKEDLAFVKNLFLYLLAVWDRQIDQDKLPAFLLSLMQHGCDALLTFQKTGQFSNKDLEATSDGSTHFFLLPVVVPTKGR
jgi:DNA-binding XRE family transcriptional regulator